MPDHSGNIYQSARTAAGITQERAAELLSISVRALADYEAGQRLPPDDVVYSMVLNYNHIPLAAQHLRNKSELGRRVVPDLRDCSLLEAVARLILCTGKLKENGVAERLLTIAMDNTVDPTELEDYEHLMESVRELVRVAMELQQAGEAAKIKGGEKNEQCKSADVHYPGRAQRRVFR